MTLRSFIITEKLYKLSFYFWNPPLRNVWGWVQSSQLRCPLTVRLTSRLLEVIDWVVLGPPRALSAALEVRGHLLCKSASFCTVATPGRAVSHHPLLFSPPPTLLPLVFTLGKWGRRQLNLFSLSLQLSLSSEVAPLKKKTKFFRFKCREALRAKPPCC